MTTEIRKAVVGYEGSYEVSDLGRVRSLDRVRLGKNKLGYPQAYKLKGRILRLNRVARGYPACALAGKTICAHRLAALAFLGPCPPGCEVRHKDGDRNNPRVSNLEYGTHADNAEDTIRHGVWLRPKLRQLRSSFANQRKRDSSGHFMNEGKVC